MIGLFLIKAYRWGVFATFSYCLLMMAMQYGHDLSHIQLPFKTEALTVFGILIVIHFGLIMGHPGKFTDTMLKMYFDDHYTVIWPDGTTETYQAMSYRARIREHVIDHPETKIYYNNPSCKGWIKRIK